MNLMAVIEMNPPGRNKQVVTTTKEPAMKKNTETSKLKLNVDKVRELTPDQAQEATGGGSCYYSYASRTSMGTTIVPNYTSVAQYYYW